jgi:hypothetical protein
MQLVTLGAVPETTCAGNNLYTGRRVVHNSVIIHIHRRRRIDNEYTVSRVVYPVVSNLGCSGDDKYSSRRPARDFVVLNHSRTAAAQVYTFCDYTLFYSRPTAVAVNAVIYGTAEKFRVSVLSG